MRFRTLLCTAAFLAIATAFAQSGNFDGLNYQAVIRDAGGDPVPNQPVGVRVQINSGLTAGYSETHSATTDAHGLMSLVMGQGSPEPGSVVPTFSDLDWSGPVMNYTVSVDITGGSNYVVLGGGVFKAVPFAMHALTGGDGGTGWSLLGNNLSNTNTGYVGIGTSSPNFKLHVETNDPNGVASFRNTDPNGASKIEFYDDVEPQYPFLTIGKGNSATGALPGSSHISSTNRLTLGTQGNPNLVIEPTGEMGFNGPATPFTTATFGGNGRSLSLLAGNGEDISWDGGNTGEAILKNTGPLPGATTFQNTSGDPLLTLRNTGEVGIGTSSPGGLFETSKADGAFVVRSWPGNGSDVVVTDIVGRSGFMPQQRYSSEDSPNWVDLGLSPVQAFTVETNDEPRFTIAQQGDVGIGTTTPAAKLDVAGTFKLTDGSEGASKVLTSDGGGRATWKNLSAESMFGTGNVPAGDLSCMSVLATVGTGTFPRAIALAGDHAYVLNNFSNTLRIFNISDPAVPSISATITTGTNPIDLAVAGSYAYVVGLTNDMRVYNISDPASPSLVSTVPTGAVPHAVAVSNGFAYVLNKSDDNMMVYDLVNPAAPSLVASIATGSSPSSIAVSGDHAYVVNNSSNNMMVFDVTDPAAPSLSAAIATPTGPYFIKVSGEHAYVVNFGSNSMTVFNISDPGAPVLSASVTTGAQPSCVAIHGNYAFVTNSGSPSNSLMVFNVSDPAAPSLSTTMPTAQTPLAVAAAGYNAFVVNFAASNLQVFDLFCAPLAIAVDPVTGELISTSSAKWATNGTDIHTENIGNVGIGTTTPTDKLTVRTATSNYGLTHSDGTITVGSFVGGSAGGGWYGTKSNHSLHFFTNDSPAQMTLATTGNVGIGTSSPQSKLAVNGKITCKEVEVTLAGFPDYVFEKDYRLMPLAEVEAYIAANGHLPNVPSACEVEENGLGLGEMNKILLEKVEELTLHAIAKEKEVAALKREMTERMARFEALIGGSK